MQTLADPSDTSILVVDDSRADRELLVAHLDGDGYRVETSRDGAEAWDRLESDGAHFDVILLDRVMPRMNGIELLGRLKQHPRLSMIPVIMQTAASDRESIVEGIRAGAYYYLVKPYDPEMLLSIVATAATDYSRYKELQSEVRKGTGGLALLRQAVFSFRTIEEAHDLGAFLAATCPDPGKTVIGLTELLVNAVEHGNLGITYDEKTELNSTGRWVAEVERRQKLPENAGKRVVVHFNRDERLICITIRDEGRGFKWDGYLEVDPKRAFDTHGRGIAIANLLSFQRLEYHGCGNEVAGFIELA
ncbi:MAG TPA: response regulator [Thermoanaerobaculia bacterium]|nr:response regulator [Thermoanaerobaculia bacterium]